jgi:dienelactone hydrolase
MRKHTLFLFLFAAGLALASFTSAPALGAVKSRTVEYQQGGVTMKGLLFWDDAVKGKRPGVMVVHEWWGLDEHARHRAEMLAKLGYAAFAADMYGEGRMTSHAAEAQAWMEQITANVDNWRARALNALAVFRAQPEVDATRVAAIGYCFGGATVMHMAYAGADLKGVASFHGSLPPAEGIKPGVIKAKVLAAHGAADPLVPPERVQAFQKSLEDAGAVWEFVTYSGAKHSFTNPDAAKAGMPAMAYDARADRHSWDLLQYFLKEIFAGK